MQAQQVTTGFSNAPIPGFAPGDLLSGSGDSQNDPNGNGSWGSGRTTNIMYHSGWLMTGSEAPGSPGSADLDFRIYKIEDPTDPVRMFPVSVPTGIPYPAETFGFDAADYPDNIWSSGNWGFHTHGHFVSEHGIMGRSRWVENFGWPVHNGGVVINGYPEGAAFIQGGPPSGRASRTSAWSMDDDWAYGSDANYHFVSRVLLDDVNDINFRNQNTTVYAIAEMVGGSDGVRGFPVIVGNKMFLLSDQRNQGAAIYHVPDAAYDILGDQAQLDAIEAAQQAESNIGTNGLSVDLPDLQLLGVANTQVGGYWPELYANEGALYAVYTKTDNVQVIQLDDGSGDFTNPQLVADFSDFAQYSAELGRTASSTNATYPKFQDNLLMFNDFVFNMDRLIANDPDPVDVVLKSDHKQRTSQWSLPLGNLIVTGGYGSKGGMSIWLRQNAPDTTAPVVSYHIPKKDQANYPEWAPLSFIIHETLDNTRLNPTSHFTVRPVTGPSTFGDPVEGLLVFGSNNLLTFTPHQALASDQIYQVDFHSDPGQNLGFRDAAGNYIEAYSFQFSTGALPGANEAPSINSLTVDDTRIAPGDTVNLSFTASDPENDALEYRFNPGDGSGYPATWTSFSGSDSFSHTYNGTGRFTAKVQVRDTDNNRVVASEQMIVISPPAVTGATNSSSIIVASDGRVWVVNPDANTVTVIDNGSKFAEYSVGQDPRNLAEDGTGRIWVTCRDSDELYVLNSDGTVDTIIEFGYGAQPHGVVANPAGDYMYVSHYGTGNLVQIATSDFSSVFENVGPTPYAIAVNGSGDKVYVTRFISGKHNGEVYRLDVSAGNMNQRGTIDVDYDSGPDGGDLASGVPNYLAGITISPDGQYALVASKQDNVLRGELYGLDDLTFETTVRSIISVIDLGSNNHLTDARRDFDNSDSPTAVAFSPDGDVLLTTLQGNNQVAGIDALSIGADVTLSPVALRASTGLAPQGIAVDAANNKVYTMDFMSRTVTIFDAADMFTGTAFSVTPEATIDTVSNELLASNVLQGKKIFYNANDVRMSADSYISCATCHIDGGSDNRVWDFTGRGEGLRRTPSLRGRGGVNHGNVHWSGNFDEIQDFEHDIRGPFGGEGFMSQSDFDATSDPLGSSKAGLSPELDALDAYVTSLDVASLPRSPHRNTDGTFSVNQAAAESILTANNCMSCHSGSNFTDSAVGNGNLRDVGTVAGLISGQRLGQGTGSLTGIDTPTLLGVFENDDYLHHGMADTLEDVFTFTGGEYYEAEDATFITTVRSDRVRDRGFLFDNENSYYNSIFGGGVVQIRDDSEDVDNDGFLDVDEDINENGQLDAGEDVDGNGELDTAEDTNDNGLIDVFDAGVEFTNVDGGSGGQGFIRLRLNVTDSDTEIFVKVNSNAPVSLTPAQTPGRGFTVWETPGAAVNLNSGTNNTVFVYTNDQDQWYLDGIIVGTSDTLAAAAAHTSVPSADLATLTSYLKQLDGRDENGELPITAGEAIVEIDPWSQHDGFVFRVENIGSSAITQIDLAVLGGGRFDTFAPGSQFSVDPVFGSNNQNPKSVNVTLNFSPALAGSQNDTSGSTGDYNAGDIDGTLNGIDVTVHFEGGTSVSGTMTNVGDSDDGDSDLWRVTLVSGGGATVLAADDTNNSVNEGADTTINVLANDTGSGLSIDSVTQGSLGSVANNGSDLTYTPYPGVWSGSDSFDYTATDGSTFDAAMVSVTINATDGTTAVPTSGGNSLPVALKSPGVYGANRVLDSNGHWQIASDATGFDTSGSNDNLYMLADDTVTGNFQAYVQLVSLSGPSGSRMGLMLRDGDGAGAEFIAIGSADADGYKFQERTGTGGANAEADATVGSAHSFPGKWVLLERVGNTVTVAVDEDNTGSYTPETTVDISSWTDTLHVGLFVHSGTSGANAVAEFDNYSLVELTGATEIAADGFESGDWNGGTGWADSAWSTSANGGSKAPQIRTQDDGSIFPHEGNYFGRVRDRAYASRTVDLAGKTNASLSFQWASKGLDATGEKVVLEVNDGSGWDEPAMLSQGNPAYTWTAETVDLSSYNMVDGFLIRFRVIGSSSSDVGYFDAVRLMAEEGGGLTELLSEDFSADLSGWTADNGANNWTITSGELHFTANRGTAANILISNASGAANWSDYTASLKLRSGDDDPIGLVFYYQDSNNYYVFDMTKTYDGGVVRRVSKVVGGTRTVLASDAFEYVADQDYDVSISVTTGGNISVNFAQSGSALTEIFNVSTPADFSSGNVGFYNIYNQPSFYDDLVVTQN